MGPEYCTKHGQRRLDNESWTGTRFSHWGLWRVGLTASCETGNKKLQKALKIAEWQERMDTEQTHSRPKLGSTLSEWAGPHSNFPSSKSVVYEALEIQRGLDWDYDG